MEIKKMYLYELNFTFLKIIFLTSQTFYQNFCRLNYVIRVLFSIGHAALDRLVGWLCLTSHRQRGHLETAPPFTVPCEGREAR